MSEYSLIKSMAGWRVVRDAKWITLAFAQLKLHKSHHLILIYGFDLKTLTFYTQKNALPVHYLPLWVRGFVWPLTKSIKNHFIFKFFFLVYSQNCGNKFRNCNQTFDFCTRRGENAQKKAWTKMRELVKRYTETTFI